MLDKPPANYLHFMEWVSALAGSAGGLLPGIAFFNTYAPPMFEAVSLLTGGVAIAIVLHALKSGHATKGSAKKAIILILLGLLLVVSYGFGRSFWTVSPPAGWPPDRIQIGFYLADWSLTDKAQEYMIDHPDYTVEKLMLSFAAYDHPEKIWKVWSIISAGFILIVVFSGGFLLWAYGFALLARSLSSQLGG
ncbi:hypothetical protein [Candidatus Nitrospira neomarina]|uniref:Uncharacterized protein n=1 Tax=Candidatus Nitrospira neomarina TaxID=3020899 RepID=A0AA96GI61_9BACT|nr:hypothetical protein [Candidatus Nitrospira neomarina]WNM61913.1 hypothetical protein PQG83_19560 [Candidatus Nitrospira neomarina]